MDVFRASGGDMGVHMFFVLSGFLITTLLLQERVRAGRISLSAFYARRALRLFPALFVVILATDLYMLFDRHNPARSATLGSTPAVLFYYANWEWFTHGVGSLGWFGHCWSLAVEEQFYLAWPVTLIYTIRRGWSTRGTAVALAMASGLSLLLRMTAPHVYHSGGTFFGTPMIADQLLTGCLAAVLLRSPMHRERLIQASWRWALPAAGYLVLYFLVAGNVSNHTVQAIVTGPALTAVAVAMALIIVNVVSKPSGMLGRSLSVRPLVYLGRISYGMYLWHILICFSLGENIHFGHGTHPIYWATGYLLTVAVASVSYRFVEARALRIKDRLHPHVRKGKEPVHGEAMLGASRLGAP